MDQLVERVLAVGGYELWFVAQLTFGLVYLGGAMFLLPPFVPDERNTEPILLKLQNT